MYTAKSLLQNKREIGIMHSVQIPTSEVRVQNAGEMWKCVWFAPNSSLIRVEHILPFCHMAGH